MIDLSVSDRVRALVSQPLVDRGLELVDVDLAGATLRVLVDRPGGIDLDTVGEAAEVVSAVLDREDPVPGRYTLEVSSPGIERPLRTPEHFSRFVGTPVSVRTRAGVEGERRIDGTLTGADHEGIEVGGRRLRYDDIERAKTRFDWGPAPRPTTSRPKTNNTSKSKSKKKAST